MDIFANALIILLLLVLSGFFAGTETAFFSLSKIEKRRVEKSHPHVSKWLSHQLEHPRQTLITILIGNLIVNILATATVTLFAINYWGTGGVGPALAVFTLILILFGEIGPKILAVPHNEIFALTAAMPLRIFSWIIFPVRVLTQWITDRLLPLITKRRRADSDHISEDELKAIVKIGEEDGILDEQERYMIEKLFELGERPVRDIMTPRIDVKGLDVEEPLEEHVNLIRQYHFSYMPVFKETVDNILGVVSAQEFMLNPEKKIEQIMTQPLFVPESKRMDDLLAEMKAKHENYVICVDEYGGTAGIVTLEDMLEEIFGEYSDEYARDEEAIRSRGKNEYVVKAKISLADFNEQLSLNLEAEEASTLGGFILEKLGEVPQRGAVLETPECEIRIQEVVRRRRIHRVVVRVKQ